MLDLFVGSGTTLVAAEDTDRHAVGFDLKPEYVELSTSRVNDSQRTAAICDDARNIPSYVEPESLGLIFTSPPYANLLNRKRKNKSRRDRKTKQLDNMRPTGPATWGSSSSISTR